MNRRMRRAASSLARKWKEKKMPRRRTDEVAQIQAPWWESHEVVIIRTRMTHADQKKMYANIISARMEAGQQDLTMQFQLIEVQGAMVRTMVREWTLTDSSGKRLPLSEEAIDGLAAEDVEYIAEEIGKHNPAMSPEDRARFLAKPEASS